MGHPPFGHNGERALHEAAADIGGFEGNAQTLRLITRIEPKRFFPDGRSAGLNLTRASVDATIKYPWGPESGKRKFNYYLDDRDVFDWARIGAGEGKSAEAQIMDVADDIAYSVHDVEDAIVSGRVPLDSLATDADKILTDTVSWYGDNTTGLEAALTRVLKRFPTEFHGSLRELATLKDLTSSFIGDFLTAISEASGTTVRHDGTVVVPEEIAAEILVLKGLAVAYYMAPREIEPTYLAQRTILFDLVDALAEGPENMEPVYLEMYRNASGDDFKMRVVIDQVSALTDLSAMSWHARLCGMLRG